MVDRKARNGDRMSSVSGKRRVRSSSDRQPATASTADIGAEAVGETTPIIARNLRAARMLKQWTLVDVASRAGLAISTISKIENGSVSASFDTLLQICHALELPFESLLDGSKGQAVTGFREISRSGSVNGFDTSQYRYRVHAMELADKRMIPLVMEITNRVIDQNTDWSSHPGEEFIFVLSGELDFYCGPYKPTRLAAGDSAYIDSGLRHAFASVSEAPAKLLSVCLDPAAGGRAVDKFVNENIAS